MKLKLSSISLLSFLLFACTSPPPAEEPAVDTGQTEQQAAEAVVEPAQSEPEAYPSPVAIIEEVEQPEGYPEPESEEETIELIQAYPAPEKGSTSSEDGAAALAEADQSELDSASDSAEEVMVEMLEAGSREVLIAAADELNIHTTYNTNGAAEPQPAVILLHMLGSNRTVWEGNGVAQLLNQNGFVTLAVDMRGHGESVSAVDWAKAEEDLVLVWEWLADQPEVDAENSFVIGASIGSNMALKTAQNVPALNGAVLLSPGLNYRDVTTDDVIVEIDRPVLMFAMTNDSYSANSVTQLGELNPVVATANVIDGSAHGTNMFGVYPDLESQILAFLNANIN